MATDFWKTSGWHLLQPCETGQLRVTPDYLAAYFQRPELRPDETANAAERKLHSALVADPLLKVNETEVAALGDDDIIHNYRTVLGFRDLLVESRTLEAAYMRISRGTAGLPLPKLFLDQMTHAVLRQIMEGATDPLQARAAELFFREQTVSTDNGRIMLADLETVEMYAETGGMGGIGQLLTQTATPMRQVELDVLDEDNAGIYWDRSDRFDTVVDFRFTQPALDAFARILEGWIRHFLKLDVQVQPLQRIDDEHWRWHIGLDAEATGILNGLYTGAETGPGERGQLIALFALRIADEAAVIPEMRGRPVYLGLAMSETRILAMKPQNLLANLPLKRPA